VRTPLAFDSADGRFAFRAVAVMVDGDRVLLHRAETDSFWALPGGRVELGESVPEALRREMREELGRDVEVGRLLWIVESFFVDPRGLLVHEHALFFLIAAPGLPDAESFEGDEDGLRLVFRWFPIADLATVRLFPTFLIDGLAALPAAPTYLVHQDPTA